MAISVGESASAAKAANTNDEAKARSSVPIASSNVIAHLPIDPSRVI